MRTQDGYMTVELIITFIVGAILILSLHGIVASHTFLSQRSRSTVLANAFAEQQVESLRSIGYLGVAIGTSDITSQLPATLKKPRSATLTVSAQTSAIKKVRLAVVYNEEGISRTQTYTTYIGELGVGQY